MNICEMRINIGLADGELMNSRKRSTHSAETTLGTKCDISSLSDTLSWFKGKLAQKDPTKNNFPMHFSNQTNHKTPSRRSYGHFLQKGPISSSPKPTYTFDTPNC